MKFKLFILICIVSFSCSRMTKSSQDEHYDTKAVLGHYLFFEKRLSYNQSKSCASCHSPIFAFTDGYRKSVAANGENLLHNAPSLLNISQNRFFDWGNPSVTTLENQIKRPLYQTHPLEMGFDLQADKLIAFFCQDSLYQSLYQSAFHKKADLCSISDIEACIIAYIKTLNSNNSPYDLFLKGDQYALNTSEQNGLKLFTSHQLKCNLCHIPPFFTSANLTNNLDSIYANIGLYHVMNQHGYPASDIGMGKITAKPQDNGKFKIPSLRNCMITAPYMHDGSVNTLEEVIDIYASGGRNVLNGDAKGDGRLHPNKHQHIQGFELSPSEKRDLILFLASLTDTSYLNDSHFRNPFDVK